MCIRRNRKVDKYTLNLPTCNKVAIVFLVILISISSVNVNLMTYPLLFPHGDSGFTVNIKQNNGVRNVTCLQYYNYRLAHRGTFIPYLMGGKVTQQYIVDAFWLHPFMVGNGRINNRAWIAWVLFKCSVSRFRL